MKIVHDDVEHETDEMTYSEVIELKREIDEAITDIRRQLEKAKSRYHKTGHYADPEWFRRASSAGKIKGKQCQRLQEVLAQKKMEYMETLTRVFMEVAREHLPDERFMGLLKRAKSISGMEEEQDET